MPPAGPAGSAPSIQQTFAHPTFIAAQFWEAILAAPVRDVRAHAVVDGPRGERQGFLHVDRGAQESWMYVFEVRDLHHIRLKRRERASAAVSRPPCACLTHDNARHGGSEAVAKRNVSGPCAPTPAPAVPTRELPPPPASTPSPSAATALARLASQTPPLACPSRLKPPTPTEKRAPYRLRSNSGIAHLQCPVRGRTVMAAPTAPISFNPKDAHSRQRTNIQRPPRHPSPQPELEPLKALALAANFLANGTAPTLAAGTCSTHPAETRHRTAIYVAHHACQPTPTLALALALAPTPTPAPALPPTRRLRRGAEFRDA